jgi:hypothetical protein
LEVLLVARNKLIGSAQASTAGLPGFQLRGKGVYPRVHALRACSAFIASSSGTADGIALSCRRWTRTQMARVRRTGPRRRTRNAGRGSRFVILGCERAGTPVTGCDRERHFVLVDSGASLSVMKPGVSHSEIHPTQTAVRGITGNR